MLGKPFREGARGPAAYDCVGLFLEMQRRLGRDVPRYSSHEADSPSALHRFEPVMLPQPGDGILIRSADPRWHVGVVAGGGWMIHCFPPVESPESAITPIHGTNVLRASIDGRARLSHHQRCHPERSRRTRCRASLTLLRNVRIIENKNPFRPEERTVAEIAPFDNESLAAIVTRAAQDGLIGEWDAARVSMPAQPRRLQILLNGELIPSDEIWRTAVPSRQRDCPLPARGRRRPDLGDDLHAGAHRAHGRNHRRRGRRRLPLFPRSLPHRRAGRAYLRRAGHRRIAAHLLGVLARPAQLARILHHL